MHKFLPHVLLVLFPNSFISGFSYFLNWTMGPIKGLIKRCRKLGDGARRTVFGDRD
jgi:hypothetical protein